ncbi:hypothetical protein [Deinococcus sp. Marseille-Q6407]|uniref:hypothetical protein n=1 Tax=Deinococcus sp. Marseille-Q6407 TaxID=2969223 RepID=UPI0021BEDC21|nr:hypothetical protein [Deinococcus sp. Marseille-Q6407]
MQKAALAVSFLALFGSALAQTSTAFHGLNVPTYPGAQNVKIETDSDEYELYFKRNNELRRVYDYYVNYFKGQGFTVTSTKFKSSGLGYKANLSRGTGPQNNIELDVKVKHGMNKVEIEFDE